MVGRPQPREAEAIKVLMPAGSVIVFDGALVLAAEPTPRMPTGWPSPPSTATRGCAKSKHGAVSAAIDRGKLQRANSKHARL